MTELRDARFKRALEAAPDADARPAPAVAHTIRAAARQVLPAAVTRQAPVPWWLRWWKGMGQPRSAWGAAFATVLVAVLVTMLWVREPIPDARPIAPAASPPAPHVDNPKPAPPPAVAATEKSAATPAPVPKAPRMPEPAPQPPQGVERQEVMPPAPPAPTPAPAPAPLPEPAAAAAVEPSRRSLARSAAPLSLADSTASAKSAANLRGLEAWDTLHVTAGGRTVKLDRAQGRKLLALLLRLEQGLSALPDAGQPEPAAPPDLQVRLQTQEQVTATFTLWGQHARWLRAGQDARSGTLDEAQVQSVTQSARDALAADSSPDNPP